MGVALFAGPVLLEPTGQASDLLRHWADGGSGLLTAVASMTGAALLGLYTRYAALRLMPTDYSGVAIIGRNGDRAEDTACEFRAADGERVNTLIVDLSVQPQVRRWPTRRSNACPTR